MLTAALGTAFLALKAVEYYLDYRENLVPGFAFDPAEWTALNVRPQHVQLFLIFYYFLTGLHAIHLIIGIAVVLVLAWLAHREHFSSRIPFARRGLGSVLAFYRRRLGVLAALAVFDRQPRHLTHGECDD